MDENWHTWIILPQTDIPVIVSCNYGRMVLRMEINGSERCNLTCG